jgi:hypothetical protein
MKNKTKIFFDTEFTGLHQKTTLISIGLISECGKTFYAEFNDYHKTQLNDWLKENVIANLKFKEPKKVEDEYYVKTLSFKDLYKSFSIELRAETSVIKHRLLQWFEQFDEVEIWSDCLAYDWVLFCNLFGHAFKIPKNIYYIPFDLSTLLKVKGIDPDISREKLACIENMKMPNGKFPEKTEDIPKHNALWDAIVIKECYNNVINK